MQKINVHTSVDVQPCLKLKRKHPGKKLGMQEALSVNKYILQIYNLH